MLFRRFLLPALVLITPTPVIAQWREPTVIPVYARSSLSSWETSAIVAKPRLALAETERIPSVVKYAAAGALIGAAVGYGAYLIQENTISHTDHEMDPLVRAGSVSIGTLVGAVVGTLVHDYRARRVRTASGR
jgi:hypothetical protein